MTTPLADVIRRYPVPALVATNDIIGGLAKVKSTFRNDQTVENQLRGQFEQALREWYTSIVTLSNQWPLYFKIFEIHHQQPHACWGSYIKPASHGGFDVAKSNAKVDYANYSYSTLLCGACRCGVEWNRTNELMSNEFPSLARDWPDHKNSLSMKGDIMETLMACHRNTPETDVFFPEALRTPATIQCLYSANKAICDGGRAWKVMDGVARRGLFDTKHRQVSLAWRRMSAAQAADLLIMLVEQRM
jgi:hypothetical protein